VFDELLGGETFDGLIDREFVVVALSVPTTAAPPSAPQPLFVPQPTYTRDISLPDGADFDRHSKWLRLEMRNDDLLPAGASDAAVLDRFHRRLHGFDMRMRSGFIRRDLRKAGIRNYKAVEIVVLSTAPASSGMIAAIDHANAAFEARSVMVSYRQVP